MARTEIVHDDGVLRVGACRNLLIPTWYGSPEGTHIRAFGRAILSVSNRYAGDVGVFDMIASGTPRFTDLVRDELVKLLRDPRTQGRGSAHVVLLSGLSGVATRSFLSTALLLSRSSVPTKVFGETRAAAAWLAPILSKGKEAWTAEQILAAHAEIEKKPAPAP